MSRRKAAPAEPKKQDTPGADTKETVPVQDAPVQGGAPASPADTEDAAARAETEPEAPRGEAADAAPHANAPGDMPGGPAPDEDVRETATGSEDPAAGPDHADAPFSDAPDAGGRPDRPEKSGPAFEAFVPTDYFQRTPSAQYRRRRRIAVLCAVLVLLAAVGTAAGIYFSRLRNDPSAFFAEGSAPTPVPAATAVPGAEATPTPSPDPYAALEEQADFTLMQNIVNIMLIGVDYAEERESWSGKDGLNAAHSDVMIVLAVNFDENTASLISLPRDTYTTIPGVSGYYKLNAAINCGGGLLAENGAGFLKVCETASFLLGGIPVDYYYAVTMPAVKALVDAIGGVDYNLDISFTMQGRSYIAGRRHMNGQAVLDYLRVRKASSGLEGGQTGDAQRVKRQKKMLVAIFKKLQSSGTMLQIPDILSAFSGQLYTNCTASQTAALALYGYDMPADNIRMYSMSGRMRSLYTWNFSFMSQDTRKEIISEVYGVDVKTIGEITEARAVNVYQTKIANQYINTCSPLTKFVERLLAEDALSTATPSPTPTVTPVLPSVSPEITDTPTPAGTDTPPPAVATDTPVISTETPEAGGAPGDAAVGARGDLASGAAQQAVIGPRLGIYTDAQHNIFDVYLGALDTCRSLRGGSSLSDADALENACDALKSAALRCASTFGYTGGFTWTIPALAKTNEIYVDFR